MKFKSFYFLMLPLLMSGGLFVYLVFSHDVRALIDHYPHLQVKDKSVSYQIKKSVPKHWVYLSKISPAAKGAIVLSEDWSFYQHKGVDLNQLKKAIVDVFSKGRVRGASTISQQVIKNLFLSPQRSVVRKFHEMILAYKMEQSLSKKKILEIYLNSIEFGPGIYGIKAAARHYFSKKTSELTPREGAFLAMLLPSPKNYYVSFRKKKLTPFARSRVNSILQKMKIGKVISEEVFREERRSKFHWEKSSLKEMP